LAQADKFTRKRLDNVFNAANGRVKNNCCD
jgi:hypothetical protein